MKRKNKKIYLLAEPKPRRNGLNKQAFTLAEVMVIIAIIGIMTSVTIVSLIGSREKKQVETAASELVAVLREAQNNALTGKNAGDKCKEYEIYAENSKYTINCGPLVSFDYQLKNGVAFENKGYVSYSIPDAKPIFSDNQFLLIKGSESYSVCVYITGRIIEQSGSVCP
ncbi:MAG: hypothetical protein COU40_00280 [Candidatus Moranbacteria bacterium CG10_big_fil_rev_8_21_14_0_10_35_21]|nr:MAG: hypothetical protein COU40_00280 [Candidatus Moranbacteria bacterium CG10_big_fil_rev_8_21_14_0_10_35_21]